jgi:hypothetical protein
MSPLPSRALRSPQAAPRCSRAACTTPPRQRQTAGDGPWHRLATRPARSDPDGPACEEHSRSAPPERAQSVPGADAGAASGATAAAAPAAVSRPSSEDVWGLLVNRSMCGCRGQLRDGISWANEAGATYAACDTAGNGTGSAVEACFDAAQPSSTVVASTSASGAITMPTAAANPCEQLANKTTFVHETFHARHADDMARARGAAFFAEWRRLAGDPHRLDTLRAAFPAEVTAFEAQWNDGHDWAQDEIRSYRWERRFQTDALAALNRIC